MSELRINRISSVSGDAIEFANGIAGNADGLKFSPKIITFNPVALSTDLNVSTNQFQFTFDQQIQFSGIGTIQILKASDNTVYEEFTCGVSAGATISGSVLELNTSAGNFEFFTNYIINLPSTGIANTHGSNFAGLDGYTFRTGVTSFDVLGGDYSQVIVSPTSPTGYHKYVVFTSSGIATFTGPSASATDFTYAMVAGGGGGGAHHTQGYQAGGGGGAGGLIQNYNGNNLPAKNYTISIGAGGQGTYSSSMGTDGTYNPSIPGPAQPQYANNSGPWPARSQPGTNTTFGPTPVGTIVAYGGGRAGYSLTFGNPSPYHPQPTIQYNASSYPDQSSPTHYQAGAPGGSGGGATYDQRNPPTYNPSDRDVQGGQGYAYPSPNQQGYPGGRTYCEPAHYSPTIPPDNQSKMPPAVAVAGGGGGAGGSGNPVTNSPYKGPAGPFKSYVLGGGGGSGKSNPAFPGIALQQIGMPLTLTNEMGPSGYLAGGGGGAVYANRNASHPQGNNQGAFTNPSSSRGGTGGGGDGQYNSSPPNPFPSYVATAGFENMGGGGGGGNYPSGSNAHPNPGTAYGAPGGSGMVLFRFAHPGA